MNSKAILHAAAEFFEARAVEAHAQGMAYVRRATRLEQMTKLLNDEEACKAVQLLEREGLIVRIEADKATVDVKKTN